MGRNLKIGTGVSVSSRAAGAGMSAGVLAMLAGAVPGTALGAPTGEQVVAGQASFARAGAVTNITASNNTIINYQTFNVGSSETVRFIQPDAASRVLNRVTTADPSRIDGSLLGNGRVYLVNPAGVMVGPGATINVAGLVAAAGNLSDADFLSGNDHFTNVSGPISVEGAIDAQSVALVARTISNSGSIVADGGVVAAMIGSDVYLREADGRIYARIDGRDVDATGAAAAGGAQAIPSNSAPAGIRNTGSISAQGGVVSLGAGDVAALAIHNAGVIAAHGGSVEMVAHAGTIKNQGTVDVSVGNGAAGSVAMRAPTVEISGRIWADTENGAAGHVSVVSSVGTVTRPGSEISAQGGSGIATGGSIELSSGGDTFVSKQTNLNFSGGAIGGNGGEAVVSGGLRVGMYGTMNADAAYGNTAGTVTFSSEYIAADKPSGSQGSLSSSFVFGKETGSLFVVSTTALENFTGDVTLEAALDIGIYSSIEKQKGCLELSAVRDIRFLGLVGDDVGEQPGTPRFRGYGYGCGGDYDITIQADCLDFKAGRNIADFSTPRGTTLIANTGDILLEATAGSTEFGRAKVKFGKTLSITQADDFYMPDMTRSLVHPDYTNLKINVTNGYVTLGNPSCPQDVTVYGLDVRATEGVGINSTITMINGGKVFAGGDITLNGGMQSCLDLEMHAGTDGTGSILFCRPGLEIWGDQITLTAGNGTGTSSLVDLRTNGPRIRGNTGDNTRPSALTIAMDAPVTDDLLPLASQFYAPIAGMRYSIASTGASVTLTDGSLVEGTYLTLSSVTGSNINDDLHLASLDVFGEAYLRADVTSTLDQTYHGAAYVDGAVALGAPTVRFESTLDGFGRQSTSDTLHIAGDAVFGGAVGGGTPLDQLGVLGSSEICGGLVRTTGDQSYGDAVLLCRDTVMESTGGGTIAFFSTVDTKPGEEAAALSIVGNLFTQGRLGGVDPLASLSVSGTSELCGGLIRTVGAQTYDGAVTLCKNTTMDSLTGADITFNSTVDGTAPNGGETLTINGRMNANGALGGIAPLGELTVNGASNLCGGLVRTVNGQTYNGAVVLCADTLLDSLGGASITFNGPVDAAPGGPDETLTINGQLHANGPIGGTTPLGALEVNGTSEICGGLVRTVGGQTYGGAVTLCADTLMESTSGATIRFDSTVDGTPGGEPEALTILGGLYAGGPIGSLDPLASLSVSGASTLAGGSVVTVGDQSYGGAVVLDADTTLTTGAGGAVTFGGAVDSGATPRGLTIQSDLVANGPIGGISPLAELTVAGSSELCGGLVRTVGGQTYNGPVVLCADTLLDSTGAGEIRFESSVEGTPGGDDESLTINGTLLARGTIGAVTPLEALMVNGPSILTGGVVNTVGGQTYRGDVLLGVETTLTSTSGGLMTFGGALDAIPGSSSGLTVNGGIMAEGAIGGATPLGSLTVNGTSEICGGLVRTQAGQTYNGDVVLCADTLMQSMLGGTIAFAGSVNGTPGGEAESLVVDGALVANGAIGNTDPLRFLDVLGAASLNGGEVRTLGEQLYRGPVLLGADTTLAGSTITFRETVNGDAANEHALTVAGNLVAEKQMGLEGALESLLVTGTSELGCGLLGGGYGSGDELGEIPGGGVMHVRTLLGQTYGGDVTLCADTVLESTSGGIIRFDQKVDGRTDGGEYLRILGSLSTGGAIGSTHPLEFLEVSGGSFLAGGSVATAGDQTYGGAVLLGSAMTLTGQNINFNSTVDSSAGGEGGPLALVVDGNMHAEGALGGLNPLASLSVSGASELCGGLVNTTGDQQYGGAVILCEDTTLRVGEGGIVRFDSTVDAEAGGEEEFLIVEGDMFAAGAMGSFTPLESLRVTGLSQLSGGLVQTRGDQRYDGLLVIDRDTVVRSLDAGTLRFGNGIAAGGLGMTFVDLAIETTPGGQIRFNGDVGIPSLIPESNFLGTVSVCTLGDVGGNVPQVATIIGEKSMSIVADEFVMCQGEKFTTLGDLVINAARRAVLSDLTTVGDLSVRSADIRINRRAASNLKDKGEGLLNDRGVDFVAGGRLAWEGLTTLDKDGPAPTFSSGDGVRPGALAGYEFTKTPAGDATLDRLTLEDGTVLDQRTLAPRSVPTGDHDNVLASLQPPKYVDPIKPAVFDVRAMARLAVTSRGVSPEEAIGAMAGRYLINDLPAGVDRYGEERTYSAARVDIDAAMRVVDRFNAVFGLPGRDRSPQIGAALAEAHDRYLTSSLRAQSFGSYLDATPGEVEALGYVSSIRTLLDDLRAMGLPEMEYRRARDRILGEIATPGRLSVEQLADLIERAPAHAS